MDRDGDATAEEIDDAQVAVVARAVVDTVLELDSAGEPLQLLTGRQASFLMGWWTALCRQAQGVVVLADADLAYETASLLRGMIEQAVLIELISRDPDAWRIVERARRFKLEQFEWWLADKDYGSWGALSTTREQLSQPSPADRPELDRLAIFIEQCKQIGSKGDVAYARFQFLTHHGYASNESAMTFVPLSGCDFEVCQGFRPLASPTPEALAALILLESACEPIRWAMGGPPFHVDRPSPD